MNNQNQPAKQKDPSATPFSGYSGPPPPPLPPLPPPYPQSYYPMFEYPSAFGPPVNLKHLASQCDDPVTRAVAKSAMLVQKAAVRTKVPVVFRCDVCNINVASRRVLAMHLQGKPHQRNIKRKEMMARIHQNLVKQEKQQVAAAGATISPSPTGQDENPSASSNSRSSNVLRLNCDLCGITVNSLQQLEVHNTGSKHRSKLAKSGLPMPPDQGKKTEDSINWEDLPGSIIKLEESKGFKCKTCNRTLNSKTQVVEHLQSKRHLSMEKNLSEVSCELVGTRVHPYKSQGFRQSNAPFCPSSSTTWKRKCLLEDEKLVKPLQLFVPAATEK